MTNSNESKTVTNGNPKIPGLCIYVFLLKYTQREKLKLLKKKRQYLNNKKIYKNRFFCIYIKRYQKFCIKL